MPAAFFGHGNPMNALEVNRYTSAWKAFGDTVPHPRAILVVSAHWYINATAVTAMPRPRTIHDFYGFPPALFEVQYPAPGLPEMAAEVSDVVHPTWVWKLTDEGYDWAQRFDEDAKTRMLTDPTEFATLDAHRDFTRAAPTPDHFIPALYLAGLAGAADEPDTQVLVDGYAYGSLSMTAYTLGLTCPTNPGGPGAPQPPADLPPDASNI
jgi:aromatic ring-opening dioxygenase catalytic subunit (LigB family)